MDQITLKLSSVLDNALISLAAGLLMSLVAHCWKAISSRARRFK